MVIASIVISAVAVIASGYAVYWLRRCRKAERELQRIRMERFMEKSPFARKLATDTGAAARNLGERLLTPAGQIVEQIRAEVIRRPPHA